MFLPVLTATLTITSAFQKQDLPSKTVWWLRKQNVGGIGDLTGSYASNAEWVIFCQKGRRAFRHTTLMENKGKEGTVRHGRREPNRKYKTRFNACWFGPEYPKATYNSIWPKQNGIYHPTIKNVEFLSWLVQISSDPKELVFDGFMGTGSTALAAMQTGRNYLGAEINRGYFEICQRRTGNLGAVMKPEAEKPYLELP